MLRHGIEALTAVVLLFGCATIESLGSFATEGSRAQDWPEDTLLAGEVVEVREETVILTQFKQSVPRFRAVRPFGVVHAFLPKGMTVGNGDVVALRSTQQGHVVIRVVEKREDSGDCFYEDRGGGDRNFRDAMFCHSLGREGWRWVNQRYFVKLPPKQD